MRQTLHLLAQSCTASPGQIQPRLQPLRFEQRQSPKQRGVVFLPSKPRGHEDGRFALLPVGGQQAVGEFLQGNAVQDGDAALGRKTALYQRLAHAFGDADAGLGERGQCQRLAQALGGVALAAVVFDVKDARHAFGHGRLAAPDVVTKAVGKDGIGLPAADDAPQLPHRKGVQPVGDHAHVQPLVAQRLHAGGAGVAFAPQHQQGVCARRALGGQAQVDGNLGCARKTAGDKVQDAHQLKRKKEGTPRRQEKRAWQQGQPLGKVKAARAQPFSARPGTLRPL